MLADNKRRVIDVDYFLVFCNEQFKILPGKAECHPLIVPSRNATLQPPWCFSPGCHLARSVTGLFVGQAMALILYRPMVHLTRLLFGSIPKWRPSPIRSRSSVTGAVDMSSREAAPTSTSTSLAWVQVHDASPASYGLQTWSGYEEMVRVGEPLPTRKRMTLEGSVFDYYDHDTFAVAYRCSPRDAPVGIKTLDLVNMRKAKAKQTITHAIMEIDKTLTGRLSVEDPYTKSEASITFDAGVARQREGLVLGNGMSEALVKKG